jgi:Xaa-Pro dipeptidase
MTGSQIKFLTRQKKLKLAIQNSSLDAFVINPSPSLHYFTGLHYHMSERPVVVIFPALGNPAIVLPKFETAKLEEVNYPLQSFPYGEDPSQWVEAFTQALQQTKLQNSTIGVEPRALRVLELNLLQQASLHTEFIPAEETIAALRMFKDNTEITAMRRAVQVAQDALKATLSKIKIGNSEKEIAADLTMQLLQHGSKPQLPFFPIVSTGPNSANPHAAPSDQKLAEGDLLVIDYGANVDDYFSDITRTFAIGSVEPEFQKIAKVVLAANQAGHTAARPGLPIAEVDKAARDVIELAGYGEYFIHRTGHGLGLDGHEEPYIRGDNLNNIEIGMSFTIEPGIYLPNRGGVRIEDDVIITENGCESLTDLPRELIRIG